MKSLIPLLFLAYLCAACSQDAERLSPQPLAQHNLEYPIEEIQLEPGSSLAEEASFVNPSQGVQPGSSLAEAPSLIREGDWTYPQRVPACRHKGTLIRTEVTHCGLLIRLDDGMILEPASLPYPMRQLQAGQRVTIAFTIRSEQNSNCDAGILADIQCLTIQDKDPETYHEAREEPSRK